MVFGHSVRYKLTFADRKLKHLKSGKNINSYYTGRAALVVTKLAVAISSGNVKTPSVAVDKRVANESYDSQPFLRGGDFVEILIFQLCLRVVL